MSIDIDLKVPCEYDAEDFLRLRNIEDALFIRISDDDRLACVQLSDESVEQLRDALTLWLERAQ